MSRMITLSSTALFGVLTLSQLAACGDQSKGDTGGSSDGGASDGGASDGGSSDGGASDGGSGDGGAGDGGSGDGGSGDGGSGDGGSGDGGASDWADLDVSVSTYFTADQMLLANEINESGEPFAEALGYDLDRLDPAVPGEPDTVSYTLGIENYEYSRYQLGTVISRSGIGLHMMWAPMVSAAAAMEDADFDGSYTGGMVNGYNEDDELMKTIAAFETMSNHSAPGNPWPEFAEFVSGDPYLPQAIDPDTFAWEDFSTLRWDRSLMNKTLNPAAMGQALMKQYLWAQDMLSAYHDADDNGIEPTADVSPDLPDSASFDPDNDVYFGGDSLDGFVGMVLTAESINKVALLINALATDGSSLGAVDPMTYAPSAGLQYFPHAIAVTESTVADGLPPQATAFELTDASSDLFDQASILWGTSSFATMMDPGEPSDAAHLAYAHVFDGSPFPASMSETGVAGPYDLMKGTAKVSFLNIQAMHHDDAHHVYATTSTVAGGVASPGDSVDTVAAAYLVVSLDVFADAMAGTGLDDQAVTAITEQATFLAAHGHDETGLYYDSVGTDGSIDGSVLTLDAQAAATRALYVAARVTGDADLRAAADDAAHALVDSYYADDQHAFRSSPDESLATYTPRTMALVSGAMRESSLEGGDAAAAGIYVDFFQRVAESMQISEGANTGESGGDSDGDGIPYIPEQPDSLPPVFADQATLDLEP